MVAAFAQVNFVGLETTAVLAFLHEQLVLYRDLKPENLLLDAEGHVSALARFDRDRTEIGRRSHPACCVADL